MRAKKLAGFDATGNAAAQRTVANPQVKHDPRFVGVVGKDVAIGGGTRYICGMESDGIRVADLDRAAAARLLGDHLAAGRLTYDEHAERAAHTTTARARGDLFALFADLPQPHPRFDVPAQTPAAGEVSQQVSQVTPRSSGPPALSRRTHVRYAAVAVTAPCAVFGAGVGLFLSVYQPIGLALALIVVSALYGILVFVGKRAQ